MVVKFYRLGNIQFFWIWAQKCHLVAKYSSTCWSICLNVHNQFQIFKFRRCLKSHSKIEYFVFFPNSGKRPNYILKGRNIKQEKWSNHLCRYVHTILTNLWRHISELRVNLGSAITHNWLYVQSDLIGKIRRKTPNHGRSKKLHLNSP